MRCWCEHRAAGSCLTYRSTVLLAGGAGAPSARGRLASFVSRLVSLVAALGALAGTAVLATLAVVLTRFNLKRRHIARCAATAAPDQLERIYALVEGTGTVAANGYVLGRTNNTSTEKRCLIPLPQGLPEFPWAGSTIEARASKAVSFHLVQTEVPQPCLLGHLYRPVRVPRHRARHQAKSAIRFRPSGTSPTARNCRRLLA